jgi:hypothetical protein
MMKRALIIFPLGIVMATAVIFPSRLNGQAIGLPFGGYVNYSLPCTCSGTLWIWFTPLYLGGPIVASGPLVYSPFSTLLFSNYLIGVPGTWHLGSYVPGAQACWMIAPPPAVGCVPLPSTGVITSVGTSLPTLGI